VKSYLNFFYNNDPHYRIDRLGSLCYTWPKKPCPPELLPQKEFRTQLGLNFAKNSVKNDKVSSMFPLNPSGYNMVTRNPEKFHVQYCRTERLAKSAIPYLQRLLNLHYK